MSWLFSFLSCLHLLLQKRIFNYSVLFVFGLWLILSRNSSHFMSERNKNIDRFVSGAWLVGWFANWSVTSAHELASEAVLFQNFDCFENSPPVFAELWSQINTVYVVLDWYVRNRKLKGFTWLLVNLARIKNIKRSGAMLTAITDASKWGCFDFGSEGVQSVLDCPSWQSKSSGV